MEAWLTQSLVDNLGIAEEAARTAAPVLIGAVTLLLGALTPRLKRYAARGAYAVGGAALSPFVTTPSPALAAFLKAIEGEDARYEVTKVRSGDKDVTEHRTLSAKNVVVEFNTDQTGEAREILYDDGSLLALLEPHEQDWAKRAAGRRRAQVTERDREAARARAAARIAGGGAA